jgi:hypothetical protein
MSWTKVVTDPLGIAGFALALVFAVVSRLVRQKSKKHLQWILPVAYTLAAAWIAGGFFLAYQHVSVVSATPTMRIDKIDQRADNGAAVAGVQGSAESGHNAEQSRILVQNRRARYLSRLLL